MNCPVGACQPFIILRWKRLSAIIASKTLEDYIGSYDINVSTFQFLSERLWPDLLQTYTYVLSNVKKRGDAYYEVEFNTNDILSLYNGMTYVDAVNEFSRKAKIDENILRHIVIREEE